MVFNVLLLGPRLENHVFMLFLRFSVDSAELSQPINGTNMEMNKMLESLRRYARTWIAAVRLLYVLNQEVNGGRSRGYHYCNDWRLLYNMTGARTGTVRSDASDCRYRSRDEGREPR